MHLPRQIRPQSGGGTHWPPADRGKTGSDAVPQTFGAVLGLLLPFKLNSRNYPLRGMHIEHFRSYAYEPPHIDLNGYIEQCKATLRSRLFSWILQCNSCHVALGTCYVHATTKLVHQRLPTLYSLSLLKKKTLIEQVKKFWKSDGA